MLLSLGLFLILFVLFGLPAISKGLRRNKASHGGETLSATAPVKASIRLPSFLIAVLFRKSADGKLEASTFGKWLGAHRFTAMGVFWGATMFIAMALVPVLIDRFHGKGFDGGRLLSGALICGLGGLGFGIMMSFSSGRLRNKAKPDPSTHF